VTFAVSGDAYDNFMGRCSRELAPAFADFAGLEPGQTVVDVGCGSGILTEELGGRLGPEAVAAADPSPLVEAAAARVPGADVRKAPAENLPWPDGSFDASQMGDLGLSSSDVAEVLGHSTAGVTERIYTHVWNREAREQRIREALEAAGGAS
jgi:SAM-dependent methyltransferase